MRHILYNAQIRLLHVCFALQSLLGSPAIVSGRSMVNTKLYIGFYEIVRCCVHNYDSAYLYSTSLAMFRRQGVFG